MPSWNAAAWAVVAGATLAAQQPNTPFAGLTVDGVAGPQYPLTTGVRFNTAATIAVAGWPAARFLLALSATGHVQPGAAAFFGDSFDLPTQPAPVVWLDGFSGPGAGAFATDASGAFATTAFVPGATPVGTLFGLQAAAEDPTSPFGISLTAATEVVVTQGPTVTSLAFPASSDSAAVVDLAPYGFTVPFYGVAYSKLHVDLNGYVVPSNSGTPAASDFFASAASFASGPPRAAGLWCHQFLGAGAVVATVDAAPPGEPAFVAIAYQDVNYYSNSSGGWSAQLFNYSVRFDALGRIDIVHPWSMSGPAFSSPVVGITPGGGLGPNAAVPKDLSTLDTSATYVGAPSEAFFELFSPYPPGVWFPLPPGSPPTYDLQGRTLSFLPTAPGSLPQSADAYVLF